MKEKCGKFKEEHDNSNITSVNIPFKHTIVDKEKHVCYLYKQKICKFASNDCFNINGKMIKIEEKITSSDLRVIKWLTGFTIDCEFDEIGYINDKWKNN